MNKTYFFTLLLALTIVTNYLHAEEYKGESTGVWILKKMVPIEKSQEQPLLEKKMVFDIVNSQSTIWDHQWHKGESIDDIAYCHPQNSDETELTSKEYSEFKSLIQMTGSLSNLNKILRKDFRLTTKSLDYMWTMGKDETAKEPCKSLVGGSIYTTKNKRIVLIFKYPYIYYFSGGYGRISN